MCIFNCADAEFVGSMSECSIRHYLKIGTSFLLMQLHSINTKCSYSLTLPYNRKENIFYKSLFIIILQKLLELKQNVFSPLIAFLKSTSF